MAVHLSAGRINLSILRESARRELLECLDKCIGPKAIIWDDDLAGPFSLISEYSLLKEHDVTKMYPLKSWLTIESSVHNIIFICRPKLSLMHIVADIILSTESSAGPRKDFHIFFVPGKTLLCEQMLKDRGVYGAFSTIDEYSLELFPFDSDVLSMEAANAFKECYVADDYTVLFDAAKALMTLQALYGVIPYIHGKGVCAKKVCDMILRMRRELGGNEPQIMPQIDSLLLLDRNVDLLTPLAMQLTYEGLIDEIYGINNNVVKLPPEKFLNQDSQSGVSVIQTETKQFLLNSAEELYADIRDRNFNAVGQVLSKKAKVISAQFEERHGAKTVGEIKQFVSKLSHIQAAKESLANHTAIAELVKEVTSTDEFFDSLRVEQEFMNGVEVDKIHPYIDDAISKKDPLVKVLRLLCLQCAANNGFKQKTLEYYKREIFQVYGFHHAMTFANLEKARLLYGQTTRSYATLRKSLHLIVEDVNEVNPTDISYVYSGYAPLSVRLAQFLTKPGWRTIEDCLDILPGPKVEISQEIPVGLKKKRGSVSSLQSDDKKVILVFCLGGITFAEIAALRFLSHQDESPAEYIIATTKIIRGNSFLQSLMEDVEPAALSRH